MLIVGRLVRIQTRRLYCINTRSLGYSAAYRGQACQLGIGSLCASGAIQPSTHNPPPHVSRLRSVPPMNPPAPCAVTLPAHRPHACTPPPAPFKFVGVPPSGVSNSNPQHAPRILPPKVRRDARWRETTLILRLPAAVHVANPALPASALCGSAPPWGCSAPRPSLRSGTRQRPASPRAGRAPLLGSSHARGARGCPSGQRGHEGTPSRRKRVLRAVRVCAHAVRECGAPREVRRGPTSLRSHRAASGSG